MSSSTGFILASIGSAVGLGNIWRFPYIVGTNGGGAFLIPYLVAVLLFGLPLMILEFSLGKHFNTSVVPAFTAIRKRFKIAGLFIVSIVSIILSYYLVITGWVLAYSIFFIFGRPMSFSNFTGSYYSLLFFLISGGIIFFVVRAGIKDGIEKLSRFLVPVLLGLLFLLLAFALTLPGAKQGIVFYLNPDFSKMLNPLVWRAAFGQAFFSLSLGVGILFTYGRYMKDENIVKSSLIITFSDLIIAILAGLVIFPFVFTFGLDPATGVNLAFITFPTIFEDMKFGSILGGLFFSLLFIAALTSAISILEVPVATLIDSYGFERKKAALIISTIIILIGLPSALSYTPLELKLFGEPILDIFDLTFGTMGNVTAGLILTIIAGWFVDLKFLFNEIISSSLIQNLFIVAIKFFIPFILSINLVLRIIEFIYL